MDDSYTLSDILIGRVDSMRSNIDGIIKIFASFGEEGKKQRSISPVLTHRFERIQQSLALLSSYGVSFEGMTNKLPEVDSIQSNVLVEAAWKRDVQVQGRRASKIWAKQLDLHFPTFQVFPEQQRPVPPAPPLYFLPREPTRASRAGNPLLSLDAIIEKLKKKHSRLSFKKRVTRNAAGKLAVDRLRVEVENQMVAYLSFSPSIPCDIVEAIASSSDTMNPGIAPSTPVLSLGSNLMGARTKRSSNKLETPLSNPPVSVLTPGRSTRRGSKRKVEDMATKAKMAAEEASKAEQDEWKARLDAASKSAKEWETAHTLGRLISHSLERVTIYGVKEDSSAEIWGTSEHKVFQRITEIAREAMMHHVSHYPETSLEVFLSWIASYTNIFESKCQGCKKILAKDSDSNLFLPPTFRCYVMVGIHPFHPQCLPV